MLVEVLTLLCKTLSDSWTRSAAAECKLAVAGWLAVRDRPGVHSAVPCRRYGTCTLLYAGDLMFHWLASMSVPFLSSPFVAKCKLSRVCRKGDDMRAFGETIGRYCRLPTMNTTITSLPA